MSRSRRNVSPLFIAMGAGLIALSPLAFFPNHVYADEPNVTGAATAVVAVNQNCATTGSTEVRDENSDSGRYDPSMIGRGDKIKLAFYELLEPQDDKWGADRQRLQEPTKGIQLRAELSKEYLVQEDGTISIPILGTFVAEMSRPVDLQKQLESAFAEFLGRKGFVDIAAIAKQPVYVVGKVKNSGIFEYTPGMTVLHAIALAGGFDNTPVEAWQVTELSHATERVQISLDRTARMIARAVAIDAAGSSKPPVVPPELSELTGQDKAAAQISEELAPRKLAKKSLATDLKTLQASIESAAWDLDLRKQRMPLLDQSIALRQDRLVGLSKLSQSGFLGRPVLIQAQSELLEVEDRRQETLMSIDVAQDRLNKAKQELQTRQSTAGIDDEKDMLDARSEAAKAVSEGESAIGVIKAITKTALASPAAEGAKFYIIRHSKGTASVVRADETTLLQPGDLVQAGGTAKAPDLTAFDAN